MGKREKRPRSLADLRIYRYPAQPHASCRPRQCTCISAHDHVSFIRLELRLDVVRFQFNLAARAPDGLQNFDWADGGAGSTNCPLRDLGSPAPVNANTEHRPPNIEPTDHQLQPIILASQNESTRVSWCGTSPGVVASWTCRNAGGDIGMCSCSPDGRDEERTK